jgi:hypothetical protein
MVQCEVEGGRGPERPGHQVEGLSPPELVQGRGQGAALGRDAVTSRERPVLQAVLHAEELQAHDLAGVGQALGVGDPAGPTGQAAADQHQGPSGAGPLGLHAQGLSGLG